MPCEPRSHDGQSRVTRGTSCGRATQRGGGRGCRRGPARKAAAPVATPDPGPARMAAPLLRGLTLMGPPARRQGRQGRRSVNRANRQEGRRISALRESFSAGHGSPREDAHRTVFRGLPPDHPSVGTGIRGERRSKGQERGAAWRPGKSLRRGAGRGRSYVWIPSGDRRRRRDWLLTEARSGEKACATGSAVRGACLASS